MKHVVDVHVGQRIRHRRWTIGMTQQQLADASGVSRPAIARIETELGTTRGENATALAALALPVLWVLQELVRGTVPDELVGPVVEALLAGHPQPPLQVVDGHVRRPRTARWLRRS